MAVLLAVAGGEEGAAVRVPAFLPPALELAALGGWGVEGGGEGRRWLRLFSTTLLR